jgi:hypothetical protein
MAMDNSLAKVLTMKRASLFDYRTRSAGIRAVSSSLVAVILTIGSVTNNLLRAQETNKPVLKGGVEQDVYLDTSPYHLQQLLTDMYHTVSVLETRDPPIEKRFDDDVREFDALKGPDVPLAQQYDPCVEKYKEAYVHAQRRAALFDQNAPVQAINREHDLTVKYLAEASKCQDAVDNKFREREIKKTQQATPQLPIPQLSGNAPFYAQGPGGGPSASPPPPSGAPGGDNKGFWPFSTPSEQEQGSGEKPSGASPSGSVPNFTPTPQPSQQPASDPWDYARGLWQGLGDCAKGGQDFFGAVLAMGRGDFVSAAELLGLEPGQSVILRSIYQEATTQSLGASAFDAGRVAGRRICMYALVPSGLKAGGTAMRGLAGKTRLAPLRGGAIIENSGRLSDKWIQTPDGPVQLGKLRGTGAFGNVYEMRNQPGRLIKLSNANPNSAASFPRQVQGARALQNAGVPTPEIYSSQFGGPGEPSLLTMDDVATRWPQSKIVPDPANLTKTQLKAVAELYKKVGDGGLVWADGHPSNVFFFDGPGGMAGGVVDADMVFQASELNSQAAIVKNNVGNLLSSTGRQGLLFNGFSSSKVMGALFSARYPLRTTIPN